MWLEGKATLHVVYIDIHFSSAAFITGQTVEKVWEAIFKCWTTLYTGFPEKSKCIKEAASLPCVAQDYVTKLVS